MISWLKGIVLNMDGAELVVNVNDLGYRVLVGNELLRHKKLKEGDPVELAIYTQVKEDALQLYGFESFESRKLFLKFLAVNGVGPKVAMSIIDELKMADISYALKNNDYKPFLSVSGIGKKTAQRLLVDLQGKIEPGDFKSLVEEQSSTNLDYQHFKEDAGTKVDAKSALLNLGFSEKEIEKVLAVLWNDQISLNDLIRLSLAQLSKK